MLRTGRIGPALALAAGLFAIAGCGSGDGGTIPQQDSEVLLQRLDEIEASVAEGDCSAAQTNISQLNGAVNVLPSEVGTETKNELRDLVKNLEQLVADPDQCQEPDTGATGEAAVVPEEPAVTEEPAVAPEVPEEEAAPPEQPDDEGTGLEPGNSDNGPPGPGGNPNEGSGGGGD